MMMATEPIPQAMIAAGPAVTSAHSAPLSHPEPMIDVSEAHRRPIRPTFRFRWLLTPAVAGVVSAAIRNPSLTSGDGSVYGPSGRPTCSPMLETRLHREKTVHGEIW